jgi:hypothetical protein
MAEQAQPIQTIMFFFLGRRKYYKEKKAWMLYLIQLGENDDAPLKYNSEREHL